MEGTLYRIQDFELDLEKAELRRGGETVPLEPKAFGVLVHLVANRHRTVPQEELLEQVWPGRVVTSDTLYRTIKLVRLAFQEGGYHEAIKTLHRVGYRFLLQVQAVGDERASRGFRTQLAIDPTPPHFDVPAGAEVAFHAGTLTVLTFETSGGALREALARQEDTTKRPAVAIAVGPAETDERSFDIARALVRLAESGQVLLSGAAYELARAYPGAGTEPPVSWLAHGSYRFPALQQVISVFEVGRPANAPLRAPTDSDEAVRVTGDDAILGWRAAVGLSVPQRPQWRLRDCLGSGGFGEAWLAEHDRTHEKRVFKFCYRGDRLRSLQREVTLFRLLRESLGEREDIARILDWNFEQPPYFVESAFTSEGDLGQWCSNQGGAAAVPRDLRLALIADVARALAAAHAVGVLHKDVKPGNILIEPGELRPRAVLADFGIGMLTDPDPLARHGITALGMTEALAGRVTTTRSGTRRYQAPEILEGRAPTIQADIYSLGVVAYQLVVGDLDRVLAPGWERDVDDDLLRADIAALVDRDPTRRPADAGQIADRWEALPERRAQAALDRKAEQDRKRRRWLVPATAAALLLAGAMAAQNVRISEQREKAEAAAQQARIDAQRAERVTEYLTDLFNAANPLFRERTTPVTLREFVDASAARIEASLRDEPGVRGQLLAALGRFYTVLAEPEPASRLLRLAAEDARRSERWENEVEARFEIARLTIETGDLEEADAQLRRAAEAIPDAGLKQDRVTLSALLQGQARVAFLEARFDDAVEYIRQALRLRRKWLPETDRRIPDTMANLAGNLFSLGGEHYAESDRLFNEAIALFEQHHPGEFGHQSAVANHGLALNAMGLHEAALRRLQAALTMAEGLFGREHPNTAYALQSLGTALAAQGRREEAESYLKEALAVREAKRGGSHYETAWSADELAMFYYDGGDFEEAETYAQRTLSIRRETLGAEHIDVAHAEQRLAQILAASGRLDEAATYMPGAVERIVAAGPHTWAAAEALLAHSEFHAGRGDRASALRDGEHAMRIYRRHFAEDNPKRAHAALRWALVLRQCGRQGQASELFDRYREALTALGRSAPHLRRRISEPRQDL